MAETAKPPVIVRLRWRDELRFDAEAGEQRFLVDSDGAAGPSPMQLLGTALASCMGVDVAHILTRGRHDLRALRVDLIGERAVGTPAYFTRVRLHFVVSGVTGDEPVRRAIELSREKYCSVWHSLRRDIDFVTTFERRDDESPLQSDR
jgi:putative redox protein